MLSSAQLEKINWNISAEWLKNVHNGVNKGGQPGG